MAQPMVTDPNATRVEQRTSLSWYSIGTLARDLRALASADRYIELGSRLTEHRHLVVLGALAIYLAALVAGVLVGDATLIFFLVVPVAALAWAYGTRYGLLAILLSVPIHGLLVVSIYHDWIYFWWTLSIGGRGIQVLVALVCGVLRNVQRKLEHQQSELTTRNSELQQILDQVKELRGLLPICSSCKSVRDDQGYWTKLEAYLAENSNLQLSHGLCPNCASKFYPELYPLVHLPDHGDLNA